MSKKKKEWRAEKDRLLSLSLEDRRKDYRGNHVSLEKISTWANDNNTAPEEEQKKSFSLADKVSLYKGDITILELDAIVNAVSFIERNSLTFLSQRVIAVHVRNRCLFDKSIREM
ncbi:hypothetical protein Q8A67_011396 [Cirrhinus molitorella]|nr:hypothetical protein Q8A67_011396 [Cirrhinus molitorella]